MIALGNLVKYNEVESEDYGIIGIIAAAAIGAGAELFSSAYSSNKMANAQVESAHILGRAQVEAAKIQAAATRDLLNFEKLKAALQSFSLEMFTNAMYENFKLLTLSTDAMINELSNQIDLLANQTKVSMQLHQATAESLLYVAKLRQNATLIKLMIEDAIEDIKAQKEKRKYAYLLMAASIFLYLKAKKLEKKKSL